MNKNVDLFNDKFLSSSFSSLRLNQLSKSIEKDGIVKELNLNYSKCSSGTPMLNKKVYSNRADRALSTPKLIKCQYYIDCFSIVLYNKKFRELQFSLGRFILVYL